MTEKHSMPTHGRFQDLTSQRFGRWAVIGYAGKNKHGESTWHCRCDCGTTRVVRGRDLASGHSRSCGCLCREITTTHGMTGSPEYKSWTGIIKRCTNPNYPNYNYYGGRGITLCKRWRDSFEAFLSDVGPRPSPNHSIDRIDNDGNYEKSNCRWATRIEQQRNSRQNHLITFQGKTRCVAEWAELYGINCTTLRMRLNRGWSIERAFTEPV